MRPEVFETMLIRLEAALGLPAREGPDWHRRALSDAALDLPGLRPAVYPRDVEREWGELLAFRHFLRHAYAADLDPERLTRNVERLERTVSATQPAIAALVAVLGAP